MKKQVLFALVDQFADYEYPFLACALQGRILDKTSPYDVKTVALHKEPLKSIGNFTVLPDYTLEDVPADYAALILIGGNTWRTEEAKRFAPLAKRTVADGKVLGAICDATVFLGMNGLLNGKKHTSNMFSDLVEGAGENYTGQADYENEPAVRDGKLITANGTAALEFTREVLTALDAYPASYIESNYDFFKLGFVEMLKRQAAAEKNG